MSFPIVSDPVETIQAALGSQYASAVDYHEEFRGELTLNIKPDSWIEISQALRDHPSLRFDMLSDLTAVDHLHDMQDGESRFSVVVHLFSTKTKRRIRIKTPPQGEPPTIQSLTGVWIGANWHERECYDMFGIRFENHPGLRRILMPDDWEGHPLRKDYPVNDQEPFEYIQKQLADE